MKEVCPKNLNDWRKWLERNHLTEEKVLLIKHKKHVGKFFISTQELMHEAICFGWIDTTAKRRDEDTYTITYVRRNKNSKWSKNTLSYGKRLLEEGRMSPFGIKMYQEGLLKKPHDADLPENPEAPVELKKKLSQNKVAKINFEKMAPSMKKMHLRNILRAKLPETKEKRINDLMKILSKEKE
jgi:uncharacterized protein YdeI (YjbR/CyaY-like superfamily)